LKQLITINEKSYDYNSTLNRLTNLPLIEGIEVVGIHIPNFCYNQELSIAGNCRMCFIESKNALKPVISCAVNLKSYLNNEIFTESPLVFKSRENILEFLLLNHPIDCTICDQAGECDLQDHSLIHGVANKRFYSYKRVVDDKYVGPIIITAMTRCIHCTRCVRFGSEIAGLKEFGVFGRGVFSEIGIYKLNGQLTSELSGNLIDLCPVGSFTKKNKSKHRVNFLNNENKFKRSIKKIYDKNKF
jgi:NADH-quinone oxidoreductase subunit G